VEFLDLAPVPGLQAAARTLLNVWDCLQQVDVRCRLYCCKNGGADVGLVCCR
jgi:hypothetical protein